MTVAYNVQGSTTFAAAGWSDATGFAAGAELVVANPGGPITAGLDQRATDILYLDILSAWNANIGSQSAPLRVESTQTGSGRLRYRPSGGRLWLYAQNGSGDATIDNLDVGGSGDVTLLGGTFTTVTQDGGNITAGAAIGTTFYGLGGTSRWDAAGTAITTGIITRGTHSFLRAITTLTITGGTVWMDLSGTAITTLNIYGGTLYLRAGNIPTVNGYGGVIDTRQAQRAITLGGTAFNQGGVDVRLDGRTTVSNVASIGQMLAPQPL